MNARWIGWLTAGALACDAAGTVVRSGPPSGGAIDAALGEGLDAGTELDATSAATRDAEGPADADEAGMDAASVESRVDALLAQMTLAEKLGQMTMGGYTSLASPEDVTTYALGALGGAPANLTSAEYLPIATSMRARAAATRLGIPLFFAIDSVHGNAKLRGVTVFPHDIGLGCSRDPDLVRRIEAATATEDLAAGLTLSESPDVDVGRDDRWGRSYESFGEDPALVSSMAAAAVEGYRAGGILAVAKHYVGAGGTTWGTGVNGGIDQGDDELDEAQMRAIHLPPFEAALAAGARVVMVSYSSWQGVKMTASHHWLTDVLKGELGFDGMLMTDGGAILELPGSLEEQAVSAVNAGIDLVNVGQPYAAVIAALSDAVATGQVAMARVDDAVRRILRVKLESGLFAEPLPTRAGLSVVGSAPHRALAREAVAESMVLLKNEGAILPLPKTARVHVGGVGADDLGIQSGGWTLSWQGLTGLTPAQLGGGETILHALRAAAASPDLVSYSADGSGAAGADVGVAVLHELPYAEYYGDTPNPDFGDTSSPQIYDGTAAAVVAKMRAAHIPLVMLLVTGRPVRIQSMLPTFAAVVAAWLPGSEGGGVADVLYGDRPFVGTLSKSWPKDSTVLPIVVGSKPYDPLYAFGFGLTD